MVRQCAAEMLVRQCAAEILVRHFPLGLAVSGQSQAITLPPVVYMPSGLNPRFLRLLLPPSRCMGFMADKV